MISRDFLKKAAARHYTIPGHWSGHPSREESKRSRFLRRAAMTATARSRAITEILAIMAAGTPVLEDAA